MAWYFMKAPSPFTQTERVTNKPPVETPKKVEPATPPVAAIPPVAQDTAVGENKPRFEFYQVLTDKQGSEATPPVNSSASTKPVATKPEVVKQVVTMQSKPAEKQPLAKSPLPEIKPEAKAETKVEAKVETRAEAKAAPGPYYLQVASFVRAEDAEKQKAKLAMLGIESFIQTGKTPDKGAVHRVRMGPYKNADEMNHARSLMKQNGMDASPLHP
jgi:cell division protein FtsN